MRIMIESTDKTTVLNGTPVRVWEGTTENNVRCLVFVHRLAVATGDDASEFQRELKEQLQPAELACAAGFGVINQQS